MHRSRFSQYLAVFFITIFVPVGLRAQADARLQGLKDEALQMVEEDAKMVQRSSICSSASVNWAFRNLKPRGI